MTSCWLSIKVSCGVDILWSRARRGCCLQCQEARYVSFSFSCSAEIRNNNYPSLTHPLTPCLHHSIGTQSSLTHLNTHSILTNLLTHSITALTTYHPSLTHSLTHSPNSYHSIGTHSLSHHSLTLSIPTHSLPTYSLTQSLLPQSSLTQFIALTTYHPSLTHSIHITPLALTHSVPTHSLLTHLLNLCLLNPHSLNL